MTYISEVLADTPLGFWLTNEASGSLVDSSGNGRTFTPVGTPKYAQGNLLVGIPGGNSLAFTTNNYFTIADTTLARLASAWSAEVWVYRTGAHLEGAILSPSYSGGQHIPWVIRTETGNNVGAAMFKSSWVNTVQTTLMSGLYHIVATYDGVTLRTYLNGTLANSFATAPATTLTNTNVHLGKRWDTSAVYSGLVQAPAIYNYALSDARVLAHYDAGTNGVVTKTVPAVEADVMMSSDPQIAVSAVEAQALVNQTPDILVSSVESEALVSGVSDITMTAIDTEVLYTWPKLNARPHGIDMVLTPASYSYSAEVMADTPALYWKLDQASGTTTIDSSGNGRTATIPGAGVTYRQPPLVPGHEYSMLVSGISQSLNHAYTGWFNNTSISFECWIRATNWAADTPRGIWELVLQRVMLRHSDGGDLAGDFFIGLDASSSSGVIKNPGYDPNNTICHLVMTYNAANGANILYLNGQKVGTTTTLTTGGFAFPNATLAFLANFGANTRLSNGHIAHVAIYLQALTQQRAYTHYYAGTNGTP